MTFTVLGGTCLDVFLEGVTQLPRAEPGLDEFTHDTLVPVRRPPVMTVGGNAANAAAALARLGAASRLVSSWGADVAGGLLDAWLRGAGCDPRNLHVTATTSVNVTVTTDEGARQSYFHGTPFPPACAAAVAAHLTLAPGDVLLVAGYPHPCDDDIGDALRRARAVGATTALDVGPPLAGFDLARLRPLLEHVDLLFANERELAALVPSGEPAEASREAVAAVGRGLVLKRGSRGAEFHGRGGRSRVDALTVTTTTTVGAGDAFNAGFLFADAAGADPPRALRFGCATAAGMLARATGVLATPRASDVERVLAERTVP